MAKNDDKINEKTLGRRNFNFEYIFLCFVSPFSLYLFFSLSLPSIRIILTMASTMLLSMFHLIFFLILFSYFFPPLILLLLKCSVLMDLRSTTSQWTEQLNKMKVLEVVLFLPLPFIFWWIYRNFAVEKHKTQTTNETSAPPPQKNSIKKKQQRKWRKKMLNLPCILALTRQHF